MLPDFLLREETVRGEGDGPSLALDGAVGRLLQITLGITKAKEQQSLDLRIFGSADGADWGAKPLAAFPQKFYQGVSSILLDLRARPEIRALRIGYATNRWGLWKDGAEFRIYVFAEPVEPPAGTLA